MSWRGEPSAHRALLPSSSVMLLPPAVRNVVPVTASVPLSVNSPPAVTFNAPETVEAWERYKKASAAKDPSAGIKELEARRRAT